MPPMLELKNKKWTEEQFLEMRKKVLATWKTGNDPELNLENEIEYLKSVDIFPLLKKLVRGPFMFGKRQLVFELPKTGKCKAASSFSGTLVLVILRIQPMTASEVKTQKNW